MIKLEYDKKIYSIEAIRRTCIELSDKAVFRIDEKCEVFRVAIKNNNYDNIANLFDEMVLDNQTRIDTENSFKTIREIIIAQAFFPCEDLDKIIKNK